MIHSPVLLVLILCALLVQSARVQAYGASLLKPAASPSVWFPIPRVAYPPSPRCAFETC